MDAKPELVAWLRDLPLHLDSLTTPAAHDLAREACSLGLATLRGDWYDLTAKGTEAACAG
jgi:hypothetical protein